MQTTITPTEPLSGLQQGLDAAKILLREGLPGVAALRLHKLSREIQSAADDIGDCAILSVERAIDADNEAFTTINMCVMPLGRPCSCQICSREKEGA